MPVKGDIFARAHDEHVGMMQVGQLAYIHAQDVIVTRKALFVDLLTEIILEENFYNDANLVHVSIRRVGLGTTHKDFELDVSILEGYIYAMEGYATFNRLMRKQSSVIAFNTANIIVLVTKNVDLDAEVPEPETIESLKEKLDAALQKGEYEIAAELRDKIAKIENAS